jgi:hypothetical protein
VALQQHILQAGATTQVQVLQCRAGTQGGKLCLVEVGAAFEVEDAQVRRRQLEQLRGEGVSDCGGEGDKDLRVEEEDGGCSF